MVRTVRGIAGVLLLAVGAVVLAVLVAPRLFGSSAYVVTSGSMLPTFGPGAVVVTEPIDAEDLSKGDIITFVDGSGGLTTHRVAWIEVSYGAGESSTAIFTQGDANEEADPAPLDPRNVVGRAEFAVPKLGYLVEFVKTPVGAGVLAALFLFVVLPGANTSRKSQTVSDDRSQGEAVTVT